MSLQKLTLLFLFLFVFDSMAQSSRTIRFYLNSKYQTIDFFAASDCWSMQKIGEWEAEQKNRVADLLFSTSGIGLSGWRFNIGGGINTRTISHPWRTVETFEIAQDQYDWTKQEEERWFLQAAKERGVNEFVAFVNSPPMRMTRNGLTNCTENLGSTNLKPDFESQYATYLVDILKHFRDFWNIEFGYISPVNEPQWEWNNGCNQEGNRASNADIIRIVNALYDELQKQGVETKISLVESGDLKSWYQINSGISSKYAAQYGNYLETLIKNVNITHKIGKHFCGHSYWSDRLNGQLAEDRISARNYFRPLFDEGWSYWASEYCILDGPEGEGGNGRDLTMNTALNVARVIHFDLVYLDASSWSWWTAVSPEDYKDGLIYTNYKNNPSSQSIYESKTLWAFGNYSRFIRPGATRIKVSGANNKLELMASAFTNKEASQLIGVFVNVSKDNIPVSLQFEDLPTNKKIDSITPFVTTNTYGENIKEYPAFSADSIYVVPARSVVTLVADLNDISLINKTTPPEKIKLVFCYPNPFNNTVQIKYFLSTPENVKVNIYNYCGQKVKTLFNGNQLNGAHTIHWDATNQTGDVVCSGLYLCSLEMADFMKTEKIILVR